jgi:hypothetical protein
VNSPTIEGEMTLRIDDARTRQWWTEEGSIADDDFLDWVEEVSRRMAKKCPDYPIEPPYVEFDQPDGSTVRMSISEFRRLKAQASEQTGTGSPSGTSR